MRQVIDASIGNSLSINELANGYDYTVVTDFLNHHGGSFTPLVGQMRWMVIIYLVFASFISAGLFHVLTKNSEDYLDFYKGGAKYFGRFFIIDAVFALVIVVIIGISFSLVSYLFGIAPLQFDTELTFLRWTMLIAIFALLLVSLLIVTKIFAKIHYLTSEESLMISTYRGFRSTISHAWKSIGYSLFFFIVTILLIYLNHQIGSWPLLLMILVQQAIVLFKILWRITFYSVFVQLKS